MPDRCFHCVHWTRENFNEKLWREYYALRCKLRGSSYAPFMFDWACDNFKANSPKRQAQVTKWCLKNGVHEQEILGL